MHNQRLEIEVNRILKFCRQSAPNCQVEIIPDKAEKFRIMAQMQVLLSSILISCWTATCSPPCQTISYGNSLKVSPIGSFDSRLPRVPVPAGLNAAP